MRKMPTIYQRDWSLPGHPVVPIINPDAAWVFEEGGMPTRKWDGTCVMFNDDFWWARREVKPGKTPPPGFIQLEEDHTTGKLTGWEPTGPQWSFWKPFREALTWAPDDSLEFTDGRTFELIGPKINGNPEKCARHMLQPHGRGLIVLDFPLSFEALRAFFLHPDFTAEGIVWHHRDGKRMAKLKVRDFCADKHVVLRSALEKAVPLGPYKDGEYQGDLPCPTNP